MRIPTAEITVNGRTKIVNADDPRVTQRDDPHAENAAMSGSDLKNAPKKRAPKRRATKSRAL